uniref:Uncharacterized protein n=1 Tax=Setaria italica TaxID=4555 RepID=K4A485_SETIT
MKCTSACKLEPARVMCTCGGRKVGTSPPFAAGGHGWASAAFI